MKYGHETFLPLGAFEPQLGRMRLHGGGGGLEEYLKQQGYNEYRPLITGYGADMTEEIQQKAGYGKTINDATEDYPAGYFQYAPAEVIDAYFNNPQNFITQRETPVEQGINTFNEGNPDQKKVIDQINSGQLMIVPSSAPDVMGRSSNEYQVVDSTTGQVVQQQVMAIDPNKGIFSIAADDPNSSGYFTNIVSTDQQGFVNPITSEQQSQYSSRENNSLNFIKDSIKGVAMMAAMATGAAALTPAAEIGSSGLTAAEATNLANSSALADSAMAGAGGASTIPAESTLASFVSDYAPQAAGQVAPQTASEIAMQEALTNQLYGNPEITNVGSGLGSTYTGSTLGTNLNGLGTAIPSSELALGQGMANAGTLGSLAVPAAAVGGAGTALGALSGLGGATAASLAAPAAGAGIGSAIGSTLSSLLPSSALGQAALISGLGGIGSAYLGANASKNAADLQSQAAANSTQLTRDMFNTQNAQQAPQRAAGYNALNQIQGLLPGQYQQYDAAGNPTTMGTGTGYLTQQMTPGDYQNYLSPYYQFGLNQGLGQAANQANALGGRVGGNALQGLNQYAQNYAQTGAQQAFKNYQDQRSNIYNTLAGIAGIGQTAQSQTNQLAQNAATNQANLGVGSAGAQAAGQIGQASAYSGALGNIGNNFMLASLLNQKGTIF